ncbi:hypothetical protein NVP1033O_74 [Vibrio phage 1.033.O._10N.222.49.B8]|nr:hypothetical protein NVP1033O_74 [Vibrio phage 1.033.O._10N.222.49.B8]
MRTRIAFYLINLGIRLLPEEFRTHTVLHNGVLTNKIKVKRDLTSDYLCTIRKP